MQTVSFCWPYDASTVSLAGSFNDWVPQPMKKKNLFELDVRLACGVAYQYKFFVDGKFWYHDIQKPTVQNDDGVINNVIQLESIVGNFTIFSNIRKPNQPQPEPQPPSQTNPSIKPQKIIPSQKKGIIETEPVSGTRDFYPDEMWLRNWLFSHFREVGRLFGFQEYDTPILELDELYKRKAGEEITAQMYNFISKDGKEVTLRPEMTPSLARLILKAGKKMLFPIKWFAIPQCWRYEVTTRGRRREHYQWNMDIIGVSSVTAEAELLATIVATFKRLGLTSKNVGIKINSRKVLQEVLIPLGITNQKFAPVCVIVDKLDKLEPDEVKKQLSDIGLEENVIVEIQKTLSIKNLEELKTVIPPTSPIIGDLELLWKIAKEYGFDDWLIFDASVVRGLAYYTGIVFECFDRRGLLRAIAGGGRYDNLLSTYGSNDVIPACGFGFGDCVILELLKDLDLLPTMVSEIDDLVFAYNEELRGPACQVANKLREQNRGVDVQLIPKKKIHWCYNYGDRIGAKRVIFIAPDEWSKGLVRIKNLRVGERRTKDKNHNTEDEKEFNVPFSEL